MVDGQPVETDHVVWEHGFLQIGHRVFSVPERPTNLEEIRVAVRKAIASRNARDGAQDPRITALRDRNRDRV